MRTLIVFALGALLMAQTPQRPAPAKPEDENLPSIKVDVNLVNILAAVRDKRGGLVANLGKEDFTVAEDGKPQEIKYFTRETDLPLTIGLLIDVSPSQGNLITVEENAATEFFTQVLRKKDMAFLISFGEDSELLQDYTSSARILSDSMRGLRVSSGVASVGYPGGGMGRPGPVPTLSQPRGTVLYDAVYVASGEKLKSEVGRKAIVVITDGVDQGSKMKLEQAIEAAQKADVVIYSIDYEDRGFYGPFGGGGGSVLDRMSNETGGRVYKVDSRHTLQAIFKELQEEMRSQYSIGYTSTNSVRDGSYHKLDIRTKDKDMKVQARKGYYAMPEAR